MRAKLTLLTLSCLFATSTALYAKGGNGNGGNKPNRNPPMTFSVYDANNDGKISLDEFNDARAKRMQKRVDEGRMMKNAPKAPMFEDIDVDKNGYIDEDEFFNFQKDQRDRRRE